MSCISFALLCTVGIDFGFNDLFHSSNIDFRFFCVSFCFVFDFFFLIPGRNPSGFLVLVLFSILLKFLFSLDWLLAFYSYPVR